jgi:PST family polysaccharide transporter
MKFKLAFILTNTHVVIKIIAGVIMTKIISIYLGPSGMALLGQFQNTTSIISGLANGSIQTGVVKYISSEKDDENYIRKIMSSSLILILVLSFVISILTFAFSKKLNEFVFFSKDYEFIFYFLSASLIFYSLNIYILSILNGFEKIKLLTIVNVILSVITLITSTLLTIYFNLSGALISLVITQFIVFIICSYLIKNRFESSFFNLFSIKYFDKIITKKLFKFSIATFSSGAIVGVSMLMLRHIITRETSLENAGIWEGGWKILLYFNMFFVAPFSIYYFPKFSKSKKINQTKLLLYKSIKFNLPLLILTSFVIIFLKEYIIKLLFTEIFMDISKFLNYIIFGECLRIIGIFIQHTYLAKVKVYNVIIFDIIFFSIFILLSYFSIGQFGLVGVGVSYLIAAIIFLTAYTVYFYSVDPFKKYINYGL